MLPTVCESPNSAGVGEKSKLQPCGNTGIALQRQCHPIKFIFASASKGPSSSGAEDPRGGFLTLVTGRVADILESDGKRQLHLYSYSSPTVTRCLILPVLRGPLSGKMKQPVSSSPCWALLAVSQPQRAGRGNERNEEPATLKKR